VIYAPSLDREHDDLVTIDVEPNRARRTSAAMRAAVVNAELHALASILIVQDLHARGLRFEVDAARSPSGPEGVPHGTLEVGGIETSRSREVEVLREAVIGEVTFAEACAALEHELRREICVGGEPAERPAEMALSTFTRRCQRVAIR
jgi:hypothetical protein